MSIPKYGASRDENEPQIIDALRAAGCSVHQTNEPGVPDLIVARGHTVWLIEVIGDAKLAKYRKHSGLTPVQRDWRRKWNGIVHNVRSAEEALAVVGEGR